MKIGIIAPSAKIPQIELKLGVEKLTSAGLEVLVHPQCKKESLFFAGTDEERFRAFIEFASHPDLSILWAARGGYGAVRLLPLLKKWSQKHPTPPKKLFIGYSDSTALMEFVRTEWGWSTLHGPMPSWRLFSLLKGKDWKTLLQWIHQDPSPLPWGKKKLQFWSSPPQSSLIAPLLGGNLSIWSSLVGTPFLDKRTRSILFLEDVEEPFYSIDRMLQQLALSGTLDKVQAIVLGNFLNCKDGAPLVLKSTPPSSQKSFEKFLLHPQPKDLKPLRKLLSPQKTVLKRIFSEFGNQQSIPIAYGLPVGHGPEVSPLPMAGAQYELTPEGHFILKSWDWFNKK